MLQVNFTTDDTGIPHFGADKPYRGKEDNFQVSVASFLSYHPGHLLFFHVPNGGYRNAREGAKFKKMGVKAGVSDIILIEPIGPYSGLVIELKAKGGNLRPSQTDFLKAVRERGFLVAVCWNLDAVKEVVDSYLSASFHWVTSTTL